MDRESHRLSHRGLVNNGHFELAAENERRLELNFRKTFPHVVWTGREETDTSIEIALFDSLTGQVVNSGSEASATVQIVVVESEFNGKNWTKEEFNSKIVEVREKNGRKIAILAGDFYVNLEGGIGVLGHVKFTQNRIWMEKHEFRLGARIVDDDGSHGIRVREAITEPFTIRDKRLKVWKKHRPPCPSDQVWRLDKIARNGAFHERLCGKHIYTVKDFVAILHINSKWLKEEVLGPKMYPKLWNAVVEHAKTFKSDTNVLFSYNPNFQKETTVVFNIMGQLMGLIVEPTFITVDKLSETEKAEAHKLVVSALEHWKEVKSVDYLTMMECGHYSETNDIDLCVNAQPATSIMSPGGRTGVGNLDNMSGQPSSFQYADPMICEAFDTYCPEPIFHSEGIDIHGNAQPSEPLFHFDDDIALNGNTQPSEPFFHFDDFGIDDIGIDNFDSDAFIAFTSQL